MRIKIKKCFENWYTIVRAEHDGRTWFEQTSPKGAKVTTEAFMSSERLTPDACIEGSSEQMFSLAMAIKQTRNVEFRRCAVHFEQDGVHLHSPRNSTQDAVVTLSEADELANQIIEEIGPIIADECCK
jgi:hypothetical protein